MIAKVIIAEDEPLAMKRLSHLLKGYSELNIIQECISGTETLNAIKKGRPDLVFLDIQMPGLTGMEIAEQLDAKGLPVIIFVTAYDRYAVKAFEQNSVDYLLKPFSEERLKKSVQRALSQLKFIIAGSYQNTISHIIRELDLAINQTHKDAISIPGRPFDNLIALNDIQWIEANGNYVTIVTRSNKILKRSSLTEIEDHLKDKGFLRIQKSLLINKQMVTAIKHIGNRYFKIKLNEGHEFKTGQNYAEPIREHLGFMLDF